MSGPYVRLPGLAGNFLSTPDTNLADADQAHLQQSLATWGPNDSGSGNQALSTDLTPVFGDFHGEISVIGTPASTALSSGAGRIQSVKPSTVYRGSLYVAPEVADREMRLVVIWRDSGGGYLSQETGAWTPVVAGQFTQIEAGVAPSNPATALAQITATIRPTGGVGNLTAGEKYYWDAGCLREGTDPTFVPSLNIVGVLDARAEIAADRQEAVVVSKWESSTTKSWIPLHIDTGGGLTFFWAEDGATTLSMPAGVALVPDGDDSPHEYRVTFDPSTGTAVFYLDGVVAATPSPYGATSLFNGPSELSVGADYGGAAAQLDGAVYRVDVRDGIDGPIVAEFLTTDIVLP